MTPYAAQLLAISRVLALAQAIKNSGRKNSADLLVRKAFSNARKQVQLIFAIPFAASIAVPSLIKPSFPDAMEYCPRTCLGNTVNNDSLGG